MPASRTRRNTAPVARGFAAIAGHDRAISILRAHRRAGRLAHAYCLTGGEAIGKTAVARALAEELLLGAGQPSRLEVHPDFCRVTGPRRSASTAFEFIRSGARPRTKRPWTSSWSSKPSLLPL